MSEPTNKKTAREELDCLLAAARKETVSVMIRGFDYYSPLIDKFSGWVLIAAGGTATLIVTNITEINYVISEQGIKLGLAMLSISFLFGIAQKINANLHSALKQYMDKLMNDIPKIIEKYKPQRDEILQRHNMSNEDMPDITVPDILYEISIPLCQDSCRLY